MTDPNYAKRWPWTSSDNGPSPSVFERSCVGKVSPGKDPVVANLEIEIRTFEGSSLSRENPFPHERKGSPVCAEEKDWMAERSKKDVLAYSLPAKQHQLKSNVIGLACL